MIAALLVATAALVQIACVALSWAHFARVSSTVPPGAAKLSAALKRTPRDDRIAELVRLAPPSSWPHRVAAEMLQASSDLARIAALNEVLAELEHDLVRVASWPAAAVRVALLGSVLPAVAAYFAGEQGAVPVLLALGLTGAVFAAEAGRRAKHRASAARTAVDALAHALAGHLDGGAPTARERRRAPARRARTR